MELTKEEKKLFVEGMTLLIEKIRQRRMISAAFFMDKAEEKRDNLARALLEKAKDSPSKET